MPSRPEEHQLEDKSILAFRRHLPDDWVFRTEDPDYGIDGSVEIFEDGSSTGLRFYVQLKATSKSDSREVRLKRETAEYYLELDLPVLIVLYIDPVDRLLSRWIHQFDPYHGGWGEKWVTLTLSDEDEWTNQTAESIAETTRKISKVRRSEISFPMSWRVSFREAEIGGTASSRLDSLLRRKASHVDSILTFTALEEENIGGLEVDSERAVATLADRFFSTFHLRGEEVPPDQLTSTLLTLVGLTLTQAGQHSPAARIFSAFAASSPSVVSEEVWKRISASMVQAGQLKDLLTISEQLHDKEKAPMIIPATQIQILRIPSLSEGEAEAFEDYLHRRVEQAVEEGLSPASTHYNYGNFLRSRNRNLAAFKQYRQAAELEPAYWERDYFCGELAGILFDKGRFRLSARFYDCALSLGEPEEWRLLYADALAHAGEFASALQEFEEHLESANEVEPYWYLKTKVLREVVEELGIEMQKRDRASAQRTADLSDQNLMDISTEEIRSALEEDALFELAWFNLGLVHLHKGNNEDALFSFVGAGVSENESLEAWKNAFVIALSGTGPEGLAAPIAQAAYNRYGEQFIREISERMEQTHPPDESRTLQQRLPEIFEYLRAGKSGEKREFRFLDQEGGYKAFDLS
jgi:tetratricopeptide (TPR) repeat protein